MVFVNRFFVACSNLRSFSRELAQSSQNRRIFSDSFATDLTVSRNKPFGHPLSFWRSR